MQLCSPADLEVSVVVPARNEELLVARALASVAEQEWPPERLEVIVVDNGSVDATRAAVQAFVAATPRLRVQVLDEPIAGVARAKNRGAAAAVGRWLIFLDADSRMAPGLAAAVVRRGRGGYTAGAIRVVADSDDRLDRGFFNLVEFGKRIFNIPAQMLFCERAAFARAGGFDESLHLGEDRELLVRLQRAGARICLLRESWIATSTRRLRAQPLRLGMLTMLLRWALANWGIGRRWRY